MNKSNRPVIGILGSVCEDAPTPYHFANRNYWDSVLASGGLPVLLPYAEDETFASEVLSACGCRGLLFAGGDDLSPDLYGEEKKPECGPVSACRDRSEKAYVTAWDATSLPCLGICRGIQTLNVFLGGTLWQDIPSQVPGALPHGDGAFHRLIPENGPFLSLLGETPDVNSYHHQAVRDPAPSVRVEARTEDGIVEALSFRDHPNSFAVQWHPERTFRESPLSRALFARLIEEANR
ncbi:MAG: gamma-glutamyl-gamma-aminobutyrate hydrolase family protein [Clostridia bacterium]|nr:gamma-glutamyl-gamma-aminobutyrate hydrolase family protein [Clostridia bacterium]